MNQKGFWKGHPAQTPLQRRGESRRGRSMTRPWDYHWDCQWYCQALGLPVVLLGPGTDTNTVRLWDCYWDCQALGLMEQPSGPGAEHRKLPISKSEQNRVTASTLGHQEDKESEN